MPISDENADKVRLLVLSGMGAATLREACGKIGLTPAEADEAIADARQRITMAAAYQHDYQLGMALERAEDCYNRALKIQDTKTALAANRDKAKLLGLYNRGAAGPDTGSDAGTEADIELAEVRAHLAPLGLGSETDSTAELARRAALQILAAQPAAQPSNRRPHVHRRQPAQVAPQRTPGRKPKS